MWETITNLEDVCGNTFEAVAPLSSASIAPWDALTDTIDWSCPRTRSATSAPTTRSRAASTGTASRSC